jgi:predicted O-linked N-acetylglucosamine transferase (SPINDLY family)
MSSPTDPPAADELALARAELAMGQAEAAARRLQAHIERAPGDPLAHYWLAAALGASGAWAEHAAALQQAQTTHALKLIAQAGGDLVRMQSDAAYALQVGDIFYGRAQVGVASAAYGLAAMAPGAPAAVLLKLGLSLQHQGRVDEAVSAFAAVCDMAPNNGQARGFLLYSLFFARDGVARHAEAARRFAHIFDAVAKKAPESFDNPPLDGRKLRIGYVAPDAMGTQLRQFLGPVLEHYDPEATEVFHYVAAPPKTPPPGGQVRPIGHLDDDRAAELIRADAIDVLIDLWGHTAGGRLGVFARRAAPVQVSWMNYLQTTGLEEIDYLMHPDCMRAEGAQEQCSETLWYMGPEVAPFRPDPRPDPTPTPARALGYVTFGSYTHPVRLSDETIDGWSRILQRVPASRLVLRYRYYEDEVLRNSILMRFAARGIDIERIHFRGHVAQPEYYQSYAEIDFALDPSPCPAGTTILDALANGVPMLTMRGRDFYARSGVSGAGPMGLDELIAESWDDYVDRAVDLTRDPEALDALRRRVRETFDGSGRRDEAGFTRRFEGQLAQMFNLWRERRSAAAA